MITMTQVSRWYDISGEPPVNAGRSHIRPVTAHVVHYRPDDPLWSPGRHVTVFVRGPIVRGDGEESQRSGKVKYGRFGTPLDEAPAWVRDIADRTGVE